MPLPHSLIGEVTTDLEVRLDPYQLRLFAQAVGISDATYTHDSGTRAHDHTGTPIPPTFLFGLELMRPEPFAWLTRHDVDAGRILHGRQGFTFHQPAYAGETLRYRSVVTDVLHKGGGTLDLVERTAEVTRAGEAVASLRQTLIVRRPEYGTVPSGRVTGVSAATTETCGARTARGPEMTMNRGVTDAGSVRFPRTVELRPGRITRTTLALFAGGSGDQNPIHIDIDAARRVGFDDVIVPGMLPAAHVGRMLCEAFGQDRLRALDLRFVAVTPVNAEPVCRATVAAEDEDHLKVEVAVELTDGTTTITGTALVAC